MNVSGGRRRLCIVVAAAIVAIQTLRESAAHGQPSITDTMDSWVPHRIFNNTQECVASPLWRREVDTSSYEFGCKEIEAMLAGTAKIVGHGAVREVFRVEYVGQTYVVKRVRASWKKASEVKQHRIARFAQREIVALDAVRGNPNVVGMMGVCETDYVAPYLPLVMFDYILNEEADGHTMLLSEIVGLALGAARGLQALHEAPGGPIVHMDIKTHQFLVDGDGVARIDDFNLAWFLGSNASSPEGEGCPFTTGRKANSENLIAAFRPPEYISCQPLTEKVDIFSLAIIFYEMISRTRANCDGECRRTYSNHFVPPGVEFNPEWPIGFAQIMQDMWHPNPGERPSAGEVVFRLEALLKLLSD